MNIYEHCFIYAANRAHAELSPEVDMAGNLMEDFYERVVCPLMDDSFEFKPTQKELSEEIISMAKMMIAREHKALSEMQED